MTFKPAAGSMSVLTVYPTQEASALDMIRVLADKAPVR
jgi:hypothetical protein